MNNELIEDLRIFGREQFHIAHTALLCKAADAIERLDLEVELLTAKIADCRDAVPAGLAGDELAWAVASTDGVAEYVKAAFKKLESEPVKMVTPYISQEQFDRVFPADSAPGAQPVPDLLVAAKLTFDFITNDITYQGKKHSSVIKKLESAINKAMLEAAKQ